MRSPHVGRRSFWRLLFVARWPVAGIPLSRSLLGVKRTWAVALHMSAYDPKRTLELTSGNKITLTKKGHALGLESSRGGSMRRYSSYFTHALEILARPTSIVPTIRKLSKYDQSRHRQRYSSHCALDVVIRERRDHYRFSFWPHLHTPSWQNSRH
jgi:hypothetical protein